MSKKGLVAVAIAIGVLVLSATAAAQGNLTQPTVGGFSVAGAGLTSSGSTINVGAGTGVLVNANDITLNMAGGTCGTNTVGTALSATGTLTCSAPPAFTSG